MPLSYRPKVLAIVVGGYFAQFGATNGLCIGCTGASRWFAVLIFQSNEEMTVSLVSVVKTPYSLAKLFPKFCPIADSRVVGTGFGT